MGALAEALVAYARPLIDETDGSQEQVQKALDITVFCYNLAILPADQREAVLRNAQRHFKMSDEDFAKFRRTIVNPMIQRHSEMFPRMHRRASDASLQSIPTPPAPPSAAARGEKYPATGRYAPCPCGSGEKYKFCCGKKGR